MFLSGETVAHESSTGRSLKASELWWKTRPLYSCQPHSAASGVSAALSSFGHSIWPLSPKSRAVSTDSNTWVLSPLFLFYNTLWIYAIATRCICWKGWGWGWGSTRKGFKADCSVLTLSVKKAECLLYLHSQRYRTDKANEPLFDEGCFIRTCKEDFPDRYKGETRRMGTRLDLNQSSALDCLVCKASSVSATFIFCHFTSADF